MKKEAVASLRIMDLNNPRKQLNQELQEQEKLWVKMTMISKWGTYYSFLNRLCFRSNAKKSKRKRSLKRKIKKSLVLKKNKSIKRKNGRPILDGVSVFELIMPWKIDALR